MTHQSQSIIPAMPTHADKALVAGLGYMCTVWFGSRNPETQKQGEPV